MVFLSMTRSLPGVCSKQPIPSPERLSTMIPLEWINQASDRIARHIHHTPFTYDTSNEIFIKWENRQITGSFKIRGALNKVLTLQDWELERGLVTASAGNHGQGLALAGKLAGAPVKIFCSAQAVPAKVKAMRDLGAEVILVEGGYGEAEQAGLSFAGREGSTWVSPYNDGQVIAGQGTLGLELLAELPDLVDANWIVPTGGGGLISGVGAALKQKEPSSKLVAVQAQASPFFHSLYHRGSQEGVKDYPTLADGLAGPVERGSLTIPMVSRLVDDFVLVSEEEIAQAIAYAWHQHGERIEGSAAASLAAVMSNKVSSRPAVVVITGGNIQPEVHAGVVEESQRRGDRK
jgi:threonine dehydratase